MDVLKAEGDLSFFKLPSDRTGTKEPIMVLLKSVYWRHIHYRLPGEGEKQRNEAVL